MHSADDKQILLHIAAEQTVEAEADNLANQIRSIEIARERLHVSSALASVEQSQVSARRQTDDLGGALDVLPRGDQDRPRETQDAGVVRRAVVQDDEIGAATEITVETTTVREVRGRHVRHAELVAGTEGPVELLGSLPVETERVLSRARTVAVGDSALLRAVDATRTGEAVVTVVVRVIRTTGNDMRRTAILRIPEPREDAKRQHDHRLVRR